MAGHRPFSELTKDWTPERKARLRAEALREYSLSELRKAIGMAQATVAQSLGVTQSEVSKLERRPDLYISTLRRYIEAMHGELVLTVRLAGHADVQVSLADIEQPTAAEADAEAEAEAERDLTTAR